MVVSDESRAAKYAARSSRDAATASTGPLQAEEDEDEGQLTQMLEESMQDDEAIEAPADVEMGEEGDDDGNDAPRRRRKLKIINNKKDADDAMDGSSDINKKGSRGGLGC